MDYEKKYKEALERAKGMWEQGMMPERIEYIFPELKKSEDERVKRCISDVVRKYGSEFATGTVTKEKMLAWLENQGKTSWKPSKEEMDVLYGLSYITNEFDERKEEVIMRLYQDLKRVFFNGASFENMFPTNTSTELEKQGKKSNIHQDTEDDLRRQSTIRILEYARSLDAYNQYGKESIDKDIAWLEKQGESKEKPTKRQVWDYCDKISHEWWQITMDKWNTLTDEEKNKYNQFIGFNDFSDMLMNITAGALFQLIDTGKLEYEEGSLLLEEQCELKPADKVEPKFKVGDWVTNSIESVQITGYDIDYGYQVDCKGNLQHRDTDIIEKDYHLWTIQDAKDSDVLADEKPFIFRGFGDREHPNNPTAYCGITTSGTFILSTENEWWTADDFYPATKEQCDLLFQKMKEAGYEWDVEKKELKDIENKHAWSEEDERNLRGIICEIEINKFNAPEYDMETYDGFLSWLKSLKDRV
jgi:hypothetical protein